MEGTTSSGAFTGLILAEKLLKLNITQQSIETLSHWCIFHRKKAREIVKTWARKFHDAPVEQRVPFLYLANDILQNSRRKGPEFVEEFWTVLPRVLRHNVVSGNEAVKNAAYRLVDIWEERRVFGTRAQGLREELLGVKKSHEERHFVVPPYQKMVEGSVLERVARAYQTVQEVAAEERGAMAKYYAAVALIESLKQGAEGGSGNGSVTDELLEQQAVVKQCVEQLEGFEKSRALLCSHLKEFLLEEGNKRDQTRTHLQIAQARLEELGSMHRRLSSGNPSPGTSYKGAIRGHHKGDGQVASGKLVAKTGKSSQSTSVAAEVAAKLTASSSSAAMLTSVLSSLAAEETSNGAAQSPSEGYPPEKRPRVELRPPPLPPPPPPYLPYAYQSTLPPPPPPLPAGPRLVQHPMGMPPQPLPPGCAPAYQPFPPSSVPFYSQPPLPAPPAPAPRQ